MRLCHVNNADRLNRFPHTLHSYGFSPVWTCNNNNNNNNSSSSSSTTTTTTTTDLHWFCKAPEQLKTVHLYGYYNYYYYYRPSCGSVRCPSGWMLGHRLCIGTAWHRCVRVGVSRGCWMTWIAYDTPHTWMACVHHATACGCAGAPNDWIPSDNSNHENDDGDNNNNNKHHSKLATGGITSFLFTRWQQQLAIARFGWGFDLQISPSPWDPI